MASWQSPFEHPTTDDQRDEQSARRLSESLDPRREMWPFQPHSAHYDYHRPPHPAFPPSPDPAPVYPVISTSNMAPSSGNSHGRFIHSQCDQELFNVEYLRSNKASGHKNLRCFPHCCGGHNPKSFCGSGLVVECALPHAQIALGRFEELVRSPHPHSSTDTTSKSPDERATRSGKHLPVSESTVTNANNQLDADHASANADSNADAAELLQSAGIILHGRTYSRRELFRELKSPENPFGMWFKGTAVLGATEAPRFHVNGNRASWHYGWQSSRLNCKNLHVFRTYFFTSAGATGSDADVDADAVQCVASVSSPPFRISSSRKARKTFKSSPSTQSLTGSVSDDQLSIPQSSPRADDDRLSVDSFDGHHAEPAGRGPTTAVHAMRARSSFDVGRSFGYPVDGGHGLAAPPLARMDVLPSLSSRLSRATTTTSGGGGHVRGTGQPDRKRLTRSASLQTDYYSSSAGPSGVGSRQPRAQTYHGEESPARAPRSSMMSMDSLLNSAPPQQQQQLSYQFPRDVDRRPSLPSIAVPQLTLSQLHAPATTTTPVADMMQLRLGTPRGLPRTLSASSAVSSSSEFVMLRPPRSSTSSTLSGITPSPPPRRKRNRSADSGVTADNQLSAATVWHDGPLLEEIAPDGDWDLVAQAHALGLVVAVVSRLQLQKQAAPNQPATAYDVVDRSTVFTIARNTQPQLTKLCDVLVEVVAQLVHQSHFLFDLRVKMHELVARAGRPIQSSSVHEDTHCKIVLDCYEAMVAFVVPRVEQQIAAVLGPPSTDSSAAVEAAAAPSPLAELIRLAERELTNQRWWRDVALFDHENDEFPFMEFFKGYYEAVRASQTCRPLAVPLPSSVDHASLSGDWRLVQASPAHHGDTGPLSVLAAAKPTPWLQQQIESYESQTFRILDSASRVVFTLGNSLVSSASPFTAELGQLEPATCVPVDHFPFTTTRRHSLLAYRAWRENAGATVVLQSMQWPSETQCHRRSGETDAITMTTMTTTTTTTMTTTGCRQLVRTRLTTYFTRVSPSRLRVQFVLEGSSAEDAKLCAMAFAPPNDADMVEYFKAPAAWEVTAQSSLQYERA